MSAPETNGPRLTCPGCGSTDRTVAEPFCQNCAVWIDDADIDGEGED